MPKKITILKKTPEINSSIQDIIDNAQKFGMETETLCVSAEIQNIDSEIEKMGEIVIRRGVPDSTPAQKSILIRKIKESGRIVINGLYGEKLHIPDKSYQQSLAEQFLDLDKIATFEAKDKGALLELIREGKISYPFIAKKKVSGEGRGVHMIKKEEDISAIEDIADAIFQNFIKNSGEYRAYMVGGMAVAFFKKVAGKDTFKNNVSQGGTMSPVADESIRHRLATMGESICNVLDIEYAGIDFLEGLDGKLYFMEINTVANWMGQDIFNSQDTIGKKIVELAVSLYKRKQIEDSPTKVINCVREFYDQNIDYLYDKKIHYLSRMYLWTKDTFYKNLLLREKEQYINKKISSQHSEPVDGGKYLTKKQKMRETYLRKFPILFYNKLLFKNLLSQTLYDVDISKETFSLVTPRQFEKVFNELYQDHEAISILSTHAINFFYNTIFLFKQSGLTLPTFDPRVIMGIAANNKYYNDLDRTHLDLKIYLLTHMVIGASEFYAKKIDDPLYIEIVMEIEKTIANNFSVISIDNKAEFLVCAKICNYESKLTPIILSECAANVKDGSNIITDTKRNKNSSFANSEHRNVLSIMANTDFR